MNKHPNRLLPVIWGTFVMTLLSVMPLISFINLLFCSGIMLGGAAGVFFYNKQVKIAEIEMKYKDGAMIGLLCGILSAILVTGINTMMLAMSKENPMVEFTKLFSELNINLPAEVDSQFNKYADEFGKYGFSPTIAIISLVMNMIVHPLFGVIGAIISIAIIKKKELKKIN
jgi:hypothetical protein